MRFIFCIFLHSPLLCHCFYIAFGIQLVSNNPSILSESKIVERRCSGRLELQMEDLRIGRIWKSGNLYTTKRWWSMNMNKCKENKPKRSEEISFAILAGLCESWWAHEQLWDDRFPMFSLLYPSKGSQLVEGNSFGVEYQMLISVAYSNWFRWILMQQQAVLSETKS